MVRTIVFLQPMFRFFVLMVQLVGCSSFSATSTFRAPRLATSEDIAAVAQLQLNTFDPWSPPTSQPTLLSSLFGGGNGQSAASRARRAERLAAELTERVDKGSDLIVVEGADGALLGVADLSEQEARARIGRVKRSPLTRSPFAHAHAHARLATRADEVTLPRHLGGAVPQ